MTNTLVYASAKTPTPGTAWRSMTDAQRLDAAKSALSASKLKSRHLIDVVATRPDGQVIVKFLEPVGPAERGMLLLDLEEHFKSTLDDALNVWLEPLGDRSSLRNLRGIEVKS